MIGSLRRRRPTAPVAASEHDDGRGQPASRWRLSAGGYGPAASVDYIRRAVALALVRDERGVRGQAALGDPNNRMFGGSPAPVPARAYLLVDQAGNLVPREFWEEQFGIIERWIATGEVS